MKTGFQKNVAFQKKEDGASEWLPAYPNPADLRFNYYELLNRAFVNKNSIGQGSGKVAIIGAGVAGLTAARELWRSGYQVTIFEASDRFGGRLHTEHRTGEFGIETPYELGAMRMPFFDGGSDTSSAANSKNSLLSYYLNKDQQWSGNPWQTKAVLAEFPNPGKTSGGTGIYVNGGTGPAGDYSKPTLIAWDKGQAPENPQLANIAKKVDQFVSFFTKNVSPVYASAGNEWNEMWKKIANQYDKMTVSDIVFAESISNYKGDGWFGGLGMNQEESKLFYTIGAGDGSWGSFYSISAMWFIRCVMFGYSSNLQTVLNMENNKNLNYYGRFLHDSNKDIVGNRPYYEGIQSLPEMLLCLVPPNGKSEYYTLYDHLMDSSAESGWYVNTPANLIRKNGDTISVVSDKFSGDFDHVIVTCPIWKAQLSIKFEGFSRKNQLPWVVTTAMSEQHLISSCKVFIPCENFWKSGSIPQILVTDTFIQDAYGLDYEFNKFGRKSSALLVSYTWEDDATKLLPMSNKDLIERCIEKYQDILSECGYNPPTLSSTGGHVIQWALQPTYLGCSKLYRQRNWGQCYDLLAYNQQYSANSHLYFAGESYGVEGGWTEPALRLAIDAVLHVIKNSGGTFNNGFNFDSDYPKFMTDFEPDEHYPSP